MKTTARCAHCGKRHRVWIENGIVQADPCNASLNPELCLRSSEAIRLIERPPRKRGGQPAKPTADGRTFDSRGERELYLHLKASPETAAIWDHVPFPLPSVSSEIRLRTYTVDFLVRLKNGAIEAHEFKGPRALESRDFILRWGSFRATYGNIDAYLWRKTEGRLMRDDSRG